MPCCTQASDSVCFLRNHTQSVVVSCIFSLIGAKFILFSTELKEKLTEEVHPSLTEKKECLGRRLLCRARLHIAPSKGLAPKWELCTIGCYWTVFGVMWKHFSWHAFYFLKQTSKNCLFMLCRCVCSWDVRMHSAFKWGCNAFCSCRDPKLPWETRSTSPSVLIQSSTNNAYFVKAGSRLPSRITLIRGLEARYVKSCHGPSVVQLTLAYIGVCGQESSTVLLIFIFFWLNSVKEEPGWSWGSIKSK